MASTKHLQRLWACCSKVNSSRFSLGMMVLLIPVMCVQSTDKFPLQTFLQGVRIPERTGGERCASGAAHICPPLFHFSGKDVRCCQHVAHQSTGIMHSWLQGGGTVKGIFLCKAAVQTGCEE